MRSEEGEKKKKEKEDRYLYKDLHGQWEWNAGTSLVPDFTPASSPPSQPLPPPLPPSLTLFFLLVSIRHFFFFFYASLRHPPPTAMLLTESSPCSTSLPASPFTTTLCVPVQLPLRTATALCSTTIITTTAFDCCCCYCRCCCCSYYYVYTISLLFADVLFILLLTPINLDYYVSIWIMQP